MNHYSMCKNNIKSNRNNYGRLLSCNIKLKVAIIIVTFTVTVAVAVIVIVISIFL